MHKDSLQIPPPAVPAPRPSAATAVPAQYIEAPAYGSYAGQPEDSGALLQYWQILRRGKWTLVLVACVAALLGGLATLPQTPIFQARAAIEIQTLNEDFLNMRQVSPVQQAPVSDLNFGDIPTQLKILESDMLLERVAARLNGKAPGAKSDADRFAAWRRAFRFSKPSPEEAHEIALDMAADDLKIRSTPETRIVEILCDSTDPKIAADFANTLVDEYMRQNIEARLNINQRTGEYLSQQLDDMRTKLERSEDALQSYARSAGLIFTADSRGTLSEEQLRQTQAELNKAQADRIEHRSRLEMAQRAPEFLTDIVGDTSLRHYEERLTDLRSQLADLGSTYTAGHPKVKRLQTQIAEVEQSFQRLRAAIIARIRTDYDQAVHRERLLLADYNQQKGRVTADAEKSIQYNILKREVDSSRELYMAMLQRVKEASIASAIRASNARVIDPAKPPDAPYKPSLPRNAGLGLFAGLFAAAVFVVVRERYDRTIQNPDDATVLVGVPELGVVPAARAESRRRFYYGGQKRERPSITAVSPDKKAKQKVELATLNNRSSALAESFRATLTSILFSGHNGSRPRVIVFTSAHPSEGKSTVTSNLAVALAEAGQRVLLIDGDMRKPRVNDIFEVANTIGLSDLLRDRSTPPEQALAGAVRESRVAGLSLLPSGPTTAAATNLLYSPQLVGLLQAARQGYDMVLVDSPPVLQIADARVLGRVSDAVVLVIRSRKTSRDDLRSACQRFAEDGTRVLGAVLNDWDPKATTRDYGYGKNRYC